MALATRLDRQKFEPAIFCLGPPGELVTPLEAGGIPVVCFGARRPTDFGVIFRLWRELRRFRPDLVQTYLFHANIVGRVAGTLAGVRHVVSGIRVAERRSRWPLRIDRMTNFLVDANVCVSRGVAEFSERVARLPPSKTVVIPNGVDVDRFASATPADLTVFGIPTRSRVVLTVGRLDPQKGLSTLLRAARELVRDLPDVHFLLVGEGPERSTIERQIASDQTGSRIHLAGWRADVPELMRAANCLALPSLWEGMPNVVLEAMAAGLPVVATSVEGVDELIVPGQTGAVVAPGDATGLAAELARVLAPGISVAMGSAAQHRVRRDFSWDNAVSMYEHLYMRLASPSGGLPA